MHDVDINDIPRVHTIIDRAARQAAEPFASARCEKDTDRDLFLRLAHRAERTVRLCSYEYLNDLERF